MHISLNGFVIKMDQNFGLFWQQPAIGKLANFLTFPVVKMLFKPKPISTVSTFSGFKEWFFNKDLWNKFCCAKTLLLLIILSL